MTTFDAGENDGIDAPASATTRPRLARSTAIFSLATALSRILGLVREMVASYYFGAHGKINAFTVAFQFPNLVRALVADAALSSAFVPVFVDMMKKDPKRAWRVASSLFWLMLLGPIAKRAVSSLRTSTPFYPMLHALRSIERTSSTHWLSGKLQVARLDR